MTDHPAPVTSPAPSAPTPRHWNLLWGESGATPLRYATDVVVALVYLELSSSLREEAHLEGLGAGPLAWLALPLLLAVLGGIVLRWRFPRAAFTVVLVASFTASAGGWSGDPPMIAGWALYPLALTAERGLPGLGALGSLRPVPAVLVAVVVAAVAVTVAAAVAMVALGPWIGDIPRVQWAIGTGALALGASWAVSRVVRALHLSRERVIRAEAAEARSRERLLVAREVHDVVSHALGGIGMRAGVARYVSGDDPTALREALTEIETTSRAATDELRLLLGALRAGEEAPLGPQPGLPGLEGLADTARAAGLECTVSTHGVDDLSETVAVSVFRLVQESVTNAIRHAPGSTCTITVTGGRRSLEVEVTDTGPAAGAVREPVPGSGSGQLGMRERVSLLGGTFTAGPVQGGGYRVHARIPLDPGTPSRAPASDGGGGPDTGPGSGPGTDGSAGFGPGTGPGAGSGPGSSTDTSTDTTEEST